MMTEARHLKIGNAVMMHGRNHVVLSKQWQGKSVVLKLSGLKETLSLEPSIEVDKLDAMPEAQRWMVDGATVFELDQSGVNRWSAHVQGGAPTAEREAIAAKLAAADGLYRALKLFMNALNDPNPLTSTGVLRQLEAARDAATVALAKADDKAV